jgi:alpha-galactosidase
MDDSAIEGYYYKPHTTALEAQRIGLQIIRSTVGDDVYLDKDGSAMLNPVGYVDFGRLSQDTGHSFDASREAVDGIAARYYMNRNFFVSDPDAFTVSTQRINDQSWHEGKAPLTLHEAEVSIALAAITGGMLEIGDNLPSLQNAQDRVALLQNWDLINMVRLGDASVPVDLMTYPEEDIHPSVFFLKESKRQSILTVFNWTEKSRSKSTPLADLGLETNGQYSITDIFDRKQIDASSGALSMQQAPHSVHVLKIVDRSVAAEGPVLGIECPKSGVSGESLSFSAHATADYPAVSYEWDFGDGIQIDGSHPSHAWTAPGDYDVHVTADSLDRLQSEKMCRVHISSYLPTVFTPSKNNRYEEK